MTPTPTDIARAQDERIRAYLRARARTTFWYASFAGCRADQIPELHALGFHNYPKAPFHDPHPILFFEKLLGCPVHTVDGKEGSFFHTWPLPIIDSPEQAHKLRPQLDESATWREYERAIRDLLQQSTDDGRLPLPAKAFYPLDLACNICGAGNLLTWMHEAEPAMLHLFGVLTDLYLEVRRRLLAMGALLATGQGWPCVNCSDLQLPSISPEMIRRFVLPSYRRVAQACGGAFIALHCADIGLLEEVMAADWVVGCSFGKRLALAEVRRAIGHKVFVLPHYAYDDALDRPTQRNGLFWNPIVQCHSRNAEEVVATLGGHCTMAITIERPTLDEVIRVRDRLRSLWR